jgi:hypothetical protein
MKYQFSKKIIFLAIVVLFFMQSPHVFAEKTPFDNGYSQSPAANPALGGAANAGGATPAFGGAANAGGATPQTPPAASVTVDEKVTPGSLELKIKNPLGVTSIEDVIQKIMGVIVKLAIPVIICFFLYAGFSFITAQGDKEQLKKAKNMFLQTVIGAIIILGAWTIAAAIVSTVNLITGPAS